MEPNGPRHLRKADRTLAVKNPSPTAPGTSQSHPARSARGHAQAANLEADQEVANTLADLIIGGLLVADVDDQADAPDRADKT